MPRNWRSAVTGPSSTSTQSISRLSQRATSFSRRRGLTRVKNTSPGADGDMIQGAVELMFAAHQGIGMDLHIHAFELGQRGIGHGVEGLAGGVRDQMNMEFLLHKSSRLLHLIQGYAACPPPCGQTGHPRDAMCMTGG